MTANYRPPFAPYSERLEKLDPNPALRSPEDGCWTETLARAIDGATGGLIVLRSPEDDVRAACGNPDVPGSNGGTLEQQVTALGKLAPGLWFQARPTAAELRGHLAAGGIAVLAGWESDAPASDRDYDARFYDAKGANGHSIFVQGVGDGRIWWGNPEKPDSWAEPCISIDAAVKFVWPAQHGPTGHVEALLFRSVDAIPEVDMDVTKITALDHVDMAPGGSLRDATTGAVHDHSYPGAKGVGTWGKVGLDYVVRVQFTAGGPIVAGLYPVGLCTLIASGFTQADIDRCVAAAKATLKAKAASAISAL